MNSKENSLPLFEGNQTIELTFYGEKQKEYNGVLSYQEDQLFIETNHKGFLKLVPIIHLHGNNYAMITYFGLLYTQLDIQNNKILGSSFSYGTMNSENPKQQKPLLVFKTVL